ncbi:MAG: hypothetical protein IJR45_08815 [Firmicutes bacterium]|nr:hypothetical protein [Bacillota bacterium]
MNKSEALRYMGCAPDTSDALLTAQVNKCETELLDIIRPTYTYKIFSLEQTENGILLSGTNLLLTGSSVKEHLQGCHSAAAMAVTLSAHADNYIRRAEISDMAQALIADCLCTAAVEQVCDIVEKEIISSLPENTYATWRFSPGYGDLPLEIQPTLLRVLNTEKIIGLTINDSLIMLPRKSVTAIIGISDKPIEQKRRGCAVCNMRESCNFRKRGIRCND